LSHLTWTQRLTDSNFEAIYRSPGGGGGGMMLSRQMLCITVLVEVYKA
jgi:hypothetical protein